MCARGSQTFSIFLDNTGKERALKLNFTSLDVGTSEGSPIAKSVEKLHQLRMSPDEFEEDVRAALGVSTSSLVRSGRTYMLSCSPDWITFEQMSCIARHPLVLDVEVTSNSLYIQFAQ